MNAPLKNCILCSSGRLKTLEAYSHAGLVRCQDCSMVFSKMVPTDEELSRHYGNYPLFKFVTETTKKRYNEILDKLEPFRKTNKLIDVGCGEGFFLEQAILRGWEVYGTEYAEQYIRLCSEKGISMKQGRLDLKNYEAHSFDVVTSFEVLEHIQYPNEEISNFRKLVRTGGVLYLTTPNFNSLSRFMTGPKWSIISYPDHLAYFTPKTLKKLMNKNNFGVYNLWTTGVSLERMRQSFSKTPPCSKSPGEKGYCNIDREWQEKIEHRPFLKIAKQITNSLLTFTRIGDNMKGLFDAKD